MLTGLMQRAHHLRFLADRNAPLLLTTAGAAGVAATAYLTGRATFKAARLIDEEKDQIEPEGNGGFSPDLTLSSKIKLVWRFYAVPVAAGILTITSVILAHRISAKRIAALTLAAGISERSLKEYKEKVLEKLGEKKEQDVRDEIAQDRINRDVGNREIISVGTNDVLCYDMYTGRYFASTVENIKKAENEVNYELLHFGSASLSEFFDKLGLSATSHSDLHGWNSNHLLEVTYTTTKTPDDRPCIAIDFKNPPIADYSREPYA
jgi:Family of unknown function (DUF6353)